MTSLLRYIGLFLGGILLFILVAGVGLYLRGRILTHATHDVQPQLPFVAADSALLARGEHLSYTMGCRHCHGGALAGAVVADEPPFRLTAANLTAGRGGIGSKYTETDWARAIRHGVDPEGEALVGMPSVSFHKLSDADLRALVVYLQQLEPVDNRLPPTTVRPLGYALIGAGQIDVAENVVPSTTHPEAVPVGATMEYGRYLYGAACQHCHGADFRGGPHPDPNGVAVPALEAAGAASYSTFHQATTLGRSVAGDSLDDHWMPWSAFRHMTDDEVRALYQYVRARTATATTVK